MCPSAYGIMAKPCEDLSHYIMEAKPDGHITLKEKMETEKYKEDQNVELVKMQSENTELVKIQLRYSSEQIKRETQKSTGKDANNTQESTGPGLWAPPSKRQVWFMRLLADKHNVSIQSKELMNAVLADKFIQKYAKMPTAKAVSWARKLAKDRKITLYNNILKEQTATSEFIEICLRRTADDMNTFLEHYKDKANAEEEYKVSQ